MSHVNIMSTGIIVILFFMILGVAALVVVAMKTPTSTHTPTSLTDKSTPALDLLSPTPALNALKYGDTIRLQSEYTSLKSEFRLLSTCGNSHNAGPCGYAVTLRTDRDTDFNGDAGKLRNWTIAGKDKLKGTAVCFEDSVTFQGQPTQFPNTDLFLSPCGNGDCGGIEVTLRTNTEFSESQNTRAWSIGGGSKGSQVLYDTVVKIKSLANNIDRHTGYYMGPCLATKDTQAVCGLRITMHKEATSDAMCDWKILKAP